MDNHRSSDSEQWRLDRVAIAAAVAALFGPAACVRSISPAGRDRECAWVRHGRLGIRVPSDASGARPLRSGF